MPTRDKIRMGSKGGQGFTAMAGDHEPQPRLSLEERDFFLNSFKQGDLAPASNGDGSGPFAHIFDLLAKQHGMIELLRQVINSCAPALVAVNREGIIIHVNQGFLDLHPGQGEVLGRPVQEVLPGSRLGLVGATGLGEYDQPGVIFGRPCLVSLIPIRDNDVCAGAVALIRGI